MGADADQPHRIKYRRIEEPREVDAVSLGDEPQEITVSDEGPGSAHLHEFEGGLVVAIDEALDLADANGWIIVDMKNDWKTVFPD